MTYTGRCACGAVTATIGSEPVAVRQCWCRQCQKLAGGGATVNAIFRTDDLVLSGRTATHDYIAASGNTLTQHFCPACGTPVMGQSSARPQFRSLRLGFLDAPHQLSPGVAIWTEEMPPWATLDPALEQFSQQAPPPAVPKTP